MSPTPVTDTTRRSTSDGWVATGKHWLDDGVVAARHVEARLPGPVPIAIGAGTLAVVGVIEWPVALGGAVFYGAYRYFRS